MQKIIITGTSSGIGLATVSVFLAANPANVVYGIDTKPSSMPHPRYFHHIADVSKPETLPDIDGATILINNAGVQEPGSKFIDVNLRGVINCTQKYGLQKSIKAIVNVASASAHSGAEFPEYAASKGGVLAYTKWTATAIAKYGATCNSISPGGVTTCSNNHILNDPDLYKAVLDETMLNKWASTGEIAQWIYFVAAINESMTAQDILIDNGEMAKTNFVW